MGTRLLGTKEIVLFVNENEKKYWIVDPRGIEEVVKAKGIIDIARIF